MSACDGERCRGVGGWHTFPVWAIAANNANRHKPKRGMDEEDGQDCRVEGNSGTGLEEQLCALRFGDGTGEPGRDNSGTGGVSNATSERSRLYGWLLYGSADAGCGGANGRGY